MKQLDEVCATRVWVELIHPQYKLAKNPINPALLGHLLYPS